MSDEQKPKTGEIWAVTSSSPFVVLSTGDFAFLNGEYQYAIDMFPPNFKIADSLEDYYRAIIAEEILNPSRGAVE